MQEIKELKYLEGLKDLKDLKQLIKRVYSKEGVDVYSMFEWKRVDVVMTNWKTNEKVVDMPNVEFPEHFSQNACDIIASKYFKQNIPYLSEGKETSFKQLVERMVNFWVSALKDEGMINDKQGVILHDELAYMMCAQMWAPNSPQWFNTGLNVAYGIKGEPQGHYYYDEKLGKVVESKDSYTRTQGSACFIIGVEDSLLGNKSITHQLETETRLFKFGSGVGTNWSNIRGEGEPLSGGGKSSGLMSFLNVFNANAGAIKSGGTCLAPYQKVFTEVGAVEVQELAKRDNGFIALSFDPPSNRYKAKKAKAWLAGHKKVMRIVTDKGTFELTYDHPVKLSTGEFVKVEDLQIGMSLFSGNVNNSGGYMRVGLHDGMKGKRRWHQMILEDAYGMDFSDGTRAHHKDGNKMNNLYENFEFMSQEEHARKHSMEAVANGQHIFQNNTFSKPGEANGMHRDNAFWKDEDKVACYKKKQSDILKDSGRASEMQDLAAKQKMINTGYRLINAGYCIDTFEMYKKARQEHIGRMANPKKTLKQIEDRFGSYEGYLQELRDNNHRIEDIIEVGLMDVYDVEVECPTEDDKSINTGHNFLIWSLDNESDYFGTGIVVANTRRAAKMNVLDIDHPDIEQYIEWKAKEEQKVRDLGKMGYDTHFDGEAYATVGGQNANNSVRVTDDYMNKLTNNEKFNLTRRVDDKVVKEVNAQDVWTKIAKAAWECGDPGLQYDTTINAWHTCPAGEDGEVGAKHNRINASNPCLSYDEEILTVDGYRKIGDLEGKEVDIINVNGDVSRSKIWCSGIKPTVRLRLSDNRTIECTKDHRFMDIDGNEVEAKDMLDKQLMPMTNYRYDIDPEYVQYGFIQGDGILSELELDKYRLYVNIGQNDDDILDLFNISREDADKDGITFNLYKKDKNLVDKMSKLGFKFLNLPERYMPSKYSSFTLNQKASFLQGLFSANGCIVKGARVSFKTTCERLAYQILDSLKADFGIEGYVTPYDSVETEFSNGVYECKPSYQVNIHKYSEIQKFAKEIGFYHKYKQDALAELLKERAPKVIHIKNIGIQPVYDFTEPLEHWGVINGFILHNCSEYMFLDDTACNLASINLMAFYDKEKGLFDIKGYKHCISLCQLVLEATIHWGQFPTEEIARKSYMFRTTGLGYANLGALLMCMGYGYDTEEARQIGASLLSLLTGQSYLTSALMAKKVGAFKYFDLNKEHMLKVIDNHRLVAMGRGEGFNGLDYVPFGISGLVLSHTILRNIDMDIMFTWNRAYTFGEEYGYRNAQVSVLAPTGTISFAMDCSTTSSEPFFGNMVWKKLVGGGGMSIVNDCIPYGLKTLGYSEEEIEDIVAYVEEYSGLIEGAPHIKEEHLHVFDTANKASGGNRYIEPMGHVRMMAALTPQVSGAISKTVNMPNDATVEDIEEIYYRSWEMGVKAIALYRDGCKASQPLNVMGGEESEKQLEDMSYSELLEKARELDMLQNINGVNANRPGGPDETLVRVKPEGIRNAKVHAAEIGGIKLYITVSRYEDGNIAEVYVSAGRQGTLVKGLLDSISTTISEMIQYGVDPKDIAKMYRGQKFEPSGFVGGHPYIKMADSISDLISKIIDIELGDYTYCQVKPKPKESLESKDVKNRTILIQDTAELDIDKAKVQGEIIYGETCSNCGSDKLAKNGTCKVCQNCGTTTGCS